MIRINYLLAQVGLSNLLHLQQNHRRNLLREEGLSLSLELDLDLWLATVADNVERPVLHVRLNSGVLELATDQTLGVEYSVVRVHGHLVLGGIADQTLSVSEANVARGGTVTLIISDDLYLTVLKHTDARVGGSQINTDRWSFSHFICSVFCLCFYYYLISFKLLKSKPFSIYTKRKHV